VPVFCSHSLELNILRNLMVRIRDNHCSLVWNVHGSVLSCASLTVTCHTQDLAITLPCQTAQKLFAKVDSPKRVGCIHINPPHFLVHLNAVCPLLKHIQSQVQTWPEKQVLHQPGYHRWYKCHCQIQEVLPNTQKTWTVAVCRLLGINKHQHLNLTAIKEN
jgi:ADP-heptose:LPS heptosyltransferase